MNTIIPVVIIKNPAHQTGGTVSRSTHCLNSVSVTELGLFRFSRSVLVFREETPEARDVNNEEKEKILSKQRRLYS